MEVKPSFR